MPTRKQIEANRRNAQKSTGPVTAEGKAACAMNAFKTGLYAESLLIPGEKLEDLQELITAYYPHHRRTARHPRRPHHVRVATPPPHRSRSLPLELPDLRVLSSRRRRVPHRQ